jgi:hypothetical protein
MNTKKKYKLISFILIFTFFIQYTISNNVYASTLARPTNLVFSQSATDAYGVTQNGVPIKVYWENGQAIANGNTPWDRSVPQSYKDGQTRYFGYDQSGNTINNKNYPADYIGDATYDGTTDYSYTWNDPQNPKQLNGWQNVQATADNGDVKTASSIGIKYCSYSSGQFVLHWITTSGSRYYETFTFGDNVPPKAKALNVLCNQINENGSVQNLYSSIYNQSDRLFITRDLFKNDTWNQNESAPNISGYTFSYAIVNSNGSSSGTHDSSSSQTASFSFSGVDQQYILFFYTKDAVAPTDAGVTVKYINQDTGAELATTDNFPTETPGSHTYSAKIITGYALQGNSTQTIDVVAGTDYTVTFNYKGTIPPQVTISAPPQVTVGDDVPVYSSATSKDATVTSIQDFITVTGANGSPISGALTQGTSTNNSGIVWFPTVGTFSATATAIDNNNSMANATPISIKVVAPYPVINIVQTGTLKENRKVIIDATSSTGGSKRFPIDWTTAKWVISPINGASLNDLRIQTHTSGSTNGTILYDPSRSINTPLDGLGIFDITAKKAGSYQLQLTCKNTYGNSGTNTYTAIIAVDAPPLTGFSMPSIADLRDPANPSINGLSQTVITATDTQSGDSGCYSTDGDIVDTIAWFYCFDLNNNRSYLDDPWYVYNASTGNWNYTVKYNFSDLKNFNLDSYPVGDLHSVSITSSHPGFYYIGLICRESFGQEYIPQFVTNADKKVTADFK